MALNGKVRSDCNYASNPYHECTENCLRKIAEGKGRKEKKKSDNGSVIKDGGLNKKYEEKRVHPACTKASNPYHECNENCLKRISGAEGEEPGGILDFPIKLGKKKMQESRTMPPRELNNEPGRDKFYNSSASLPPKRFSSAENLGSQNGIHSSSSETHSGEIQVEDSPFDEKLVHSPQPLAASGILEMPYNPKDPPKKADNSIASEPPIYHKEVENHPALPEAGPYPVLNGTREANTGPASNSTSFTFSGLPQAYEESDDEEVQSVISDASVSVGKYRVKGRLSPILQSIFEKYGDIAASCQLESIAMRSYYLECVCFVVQELQSTQIMQLTKSKVKEMLAILKDVESSGIDVGWLRRVLSESAQTIDLISQHQDIEVAKTNCDRDLESARKQLESRMEDLTLKEKEVAEAKKLIAETRAQVRELELRSSVLSETVSSIESKVESLNSKSLLDGVL